MAASNLQMKVSAVCLGKAKWVQKTGTVSGIDKQAVDQRVKVLKLGLDGDRICNLEHHGGLLQAVYVVGSIDKKYWENDLGKNIEPGIFGENLIIEGFDTHDIAVGARLVFDDLILEATCPRIPCANLAAKMDDKLFPKRFLASRYIGVYFRVVKEGSVQAGDQITYKENPDVEKKLILDMISTG